MTKFKYSKFLLTKKVKNWLSIKQNLKLMNCVNIYIYLRSYPNMLHDPSSIDISLFVLIIICNNFTLVKNPYLIAKYVEVLFTSCPMVQPQANYFNTLLINYFPYDERFLVAALMKFYSGSTASLAYLILNLKL